MHLGVDIAKSWNQHGIRFLSHYTRQSSELLRWIALAFPMWHHNFMLKDSQPSYCKRN